MPYIRLPLRAVSPLINKGTSKYADLRVPSFIGQIRFWLRAILGAQYIDSERVYSIESSILGSTGTASSVTMQIREGETSVENVRVLPHSDKKRFKEEALVDDSNFSLKLIFRPGTTLDPRLSQALSLWLLLGGVGKRSRRMFGSVQLNSHPRGGKNMELTDENLPEWWRNWEQIEKRPHLYERLVKLSLDIVFHDREQGQVVQGQVGKSEPDFPILHQDFCRVIVAKKGFNSASQANIALFDILRKEKYRSRYEYMFGSGNPRRASPLIAQGRVFDGQYYPVFTAFRSPVKSRYPDWDIFDQAMDEIETAFDGSTVFGGKLNK